MKKTAQLFLAVVMIGGTMGCASSLMTPVKKESFVVQDDSAVIYFMRPSVGYGDGAEFIIWDKEKLVGVLDAGSCMPLHTSPGEHLFLVALRARGIGSWGQGTGLLKANLQAGKQYFVTTRVAFGFVIFDPVRKEETQITAEELHNKLDNLQMTTLIPGMTADYMEKHKNTVISAVIKQYEGGKAKFSVLEPDDAR